MGRESSSEGAEGAHSNDQAKKSNLFTTGPPLARAAAYVIIGGTPYLSLSSQCQWRRFQ